MSITHSKEMRRLTRDELDASSGELLPDRAAMSLVNLNVAAPINLALAANILSDNATAGALAVQQSYIPQGI